MSGSPRVLFVAHSMRLYGASRSLLAVLEGFREAGLEVFTILAGEGPMRAALAADGLPFAIVPFPCWVAHEDEHKDLDSFRAARSRAVADIVELLRRVRPDVVWSNTSLTPVGSLAAAAAGLPHVWHLREITGEAYPYRYVESAEGAAELMRGAVARIAVSRAAKTTFEAIGSGPCEVVYNGIASAAHLAGRCTSGVRRPPLRMIVVGRVTRDKGQLRAIEATRLLRAAGHAVELRILGDGELGPCREAIERMSLRGAVTLVGFVPDLDSEYRQADVALECSRIEAMGRTTAEAMSYGLPVVGCDSFGTSDLIAHEVTGLLCDGSPIAIARAVERVIARPEEARSMGMRAREVACRRFSNERCTAALLDVLGRVLHRASGAAAQSRTPSPQAEGAEMTRRYRA